MKFVSISELKNSTSSIVRQVTDGRSVVVVRHGKPCAVVIRISEEDIDQLLFEESPIVKQVVQEAIEDRKAGRSVSLKEYLRGKRSS